MISNLEPIAGRGVDFVALETHCRGYDAEATKLEELVSALEADMEAVKAKHLPALKRQACVVARREADLHSLIESAPGLFLKPRTVTFHGVKIGYMVANGRLTWECADETLLARIKAQYGKLAGDFIETRESIKKDALKNLDARSLAKLGCAIEGAGDVVVLKRVNSDVEKLLDKLIEKLVQTLVKAE